MPSNKDLQTSPRVPGTALTPEQKRFNTLIRQIEQARLAHKEWESNIPLFRRTHTKVLLPLQTALADACRKSVIALDALLDQDGWSRTERKNLREVLCGGAAELLAANADDAEMKTLFNKHSDVDFETGKQVELEALKEMAEEFTGLDLGDAAGIQSDEDLAERMYEKMAAQKAAAEAEKAGSAQRRRKTPAQQRREAEEQLATQSVREIYRKLASAVHPDRELDPELRDARTVLMQKINQAYAANDLLTLLEAQLQIEQVDASHIGTVSAQRLKQYNKILAEQLVKLKEEVARIEVGFYMDFGMEPERGINPRKLGRLIEEQAETLRAELARQQRDLRMLTDHVAARRWLRQTRKASREHGYGDDFFR